MTTQRAARAGVAVVLAALAAAVVAVSATAAPPKLQYTAAGIAAAKGVALRVSDFPAGWKASKGGGSGADVTCPSFDPDQSDLTTVGHADSGFESADGLGNIASVAGIFKSASQAQTSWNRLVKPPLLGCMAQFLESSATKGTTIKVTSKGPLALSVPGKRKAAYRIVADVTAGTDRAKVYLDLILQGGGPADSVLIVTSVLRAPSASLESKLAQAVGGRLPK